MFTPRRETAIPHLRLVVAVLRGSSYRVCILRLLLKGANGRFLDNMATMGVTKSCFGDRLLRLRLPQYFNFSFQIRKETTALKRDRNHAAYNLMSNILGRGGKQVLELLSREASNHGVLSGHYVSVALLNILSVCPFSLIRTLYLCCALFLLEGIF